MPPYRILAGDCVARMSMMNQNSVDNIITDPPYEIGFMGNGWDNTGIAYNPATWKAAHRVLKPNGFMLVLEQPKTHHGAHAMIGQVLKSLILLLGVMEQDFLKAIIFQRQLIKGRRWKER